jgi:hypothetical protein
VHRLEAVAAPVRPLEVTRVALQLGFGHAAARLEDPGNDPGRGPRRYFHADLKSGELPRRRPRDRNLLSANGPDTAFGLSS